MELKSVVKGAAIGAAAGAAYYAFTSASPTKKYSIKRHAGKTLRSAEDLFGDIKSIFM